MHLSRKLKKIVKNNFSPDSWMRGKGIIGHYNPIVKLYRDGKKIAHGVKRGTYKRYIPFSSHSAQSVYSSSTFEPKRISELM